MSATAALPGSRGAADRIDDACAADLDPLELFEVVTEQLQRAIPFDGFFVSATDPETMLGLGAGIVRSMPESMCDPFWAYEFEVPDFNRFTDLVSSERSVADLHAATGGRPERSARYRGYSPFGGFDAELRGAFVAGGHGWGILQLNRDAEHGAFSEQEVDFVAAIAPRVGRALRRAAVTQGSSESSGRGPGMAVFDAQQRLVSATTDAIEWFDLIRSYRPRRESALGVEVPWEVVHVAQVARARAGATGGAAQSVRTRVRTGCGAWLLIHASCMAEADGVIGQTAVVIERAKASDVAPLIVEAYELTPRELDVTRALARGLATTEIAKELFLSRYTVQDHLKRIYEKVGVAGRGELVAKMFADHYHERMDIAHADGG